MMLHAEHLTSFLSRTSRNCPSYHVLPVIFVNRSDVHVTRLHLYKVTWVTHDLLCMGTAIMNKMHSKLSNPGPLPWIVQFVWSGVNPNSHSGVDQANELHLKTGGLDLVAREHWYSLLTV